MILKEYITQTIEEELGSFNKQYDIADYIADFIEDKLDSNDQIIIDVSHFNNDDIKGVKLYIVPNYIGKTKADFLGISTEKEAIMRLFVDKKAEYNKKGNYIQLDPIKETS